MLDSTLPLQSQLETPTQLPSATLWSGSESSLCLRVPAASLTQSTLLDLQSRAWSGACAGGEQGTRP